MAAPAVNPNIQMTACAPDGCTVSYSDGLRVEIPSMANAGTLVVRIEKMDAAPGRLPAAAVLLSPVFVLDGSSQPELPFTVRLKFQAGQLNGRSPAVYTFDPVMKTWERMESRVEGNNISARLKRFATVAVFAADFTPGAVPDNTAAPSAFSDVTGHWAETDIKEVAAQGLLSGYTDGRFRPENRVTRAEFVTMLMRTLETEPMSGIQPAVFTDLHAIPAWAQPAVKAAAADGLVSGYADGSFRPNDTIRRAELAVLIGRVLELPEGEGRTPGFADAPQIPAWAAGPAAEAERLGLIQGRGGRFEPAAAVTRAEAAVLLLRLTGKTGLKSKDGSQPAN